MRVSGTCDLSEEERLEYVREKLDKQQAIMELSEQLVEIEDTNLELDLNDLDLPAGARSVSPCSSKALTE